MEPENIKKTFGITNYGHLYTTGSDEANQDTSLKIMPLFNVTRKAKDKSKDYLEQLKRLDHPYLSKVVHGDFNEDGDVAIETIPAFGNQLISSV